MKAGFFLSSSLSFSLSLFLSFSLSLFLSFSLSLILFVVIERVCWRCRRSLRRQWRHLPLQQVPSVTRDSGTETAGRESNRGQRSPGRLLPHQRHLRSVRSQSVQPAIAARRSQGPVEARGPSIRAIYGSNRRIWIL